VLEAMEKFAREGNAVIVGRGGQIILQDWPGALHVHLHASQETRIENLIRRYSISTLDAQRRIERSDEQKRLYIRNMHKNANWSDPKYYHLSIDTGRISPELAAKIIILAAKSMDQK
jgi:cytidylate kinase